MSHILLLGGTAEAYTLAERIAVEFPHLTCTTSLAGRTRTPRVPAGEVRIGGFGGEAGLSRWLRERRVSLLIDATHPFATLISSNAVLASLRANVELLRLVRPPLYLLPNGQGEKGQGQGQGEQTQAGQGGKGQGEQGQEGQGQGQEGQGGQGQGNWHRNCQSNWQGNWHTVANEAEAAFAVPRGANTFLALGSQRLAPFAARAFADRQAEQAGQAGQSATKFYLRLAEEPEADFKDWLNAWCAEVVVSRGPFDLESERRLFARLAVTHLVARHSGGIASAKLSLSLPTYLIPPPPEPTHPSRQFSAEEILKAIATVKKRN